MKTKVEKQRLLIRLVEIQNVIISCLTEDMPTVYFSAGRAEAKLACLREEIAKEGGDDGTGKPSGAVHSSDAEGEGT